MQSSPFKICITFLLLITAGLLASYEYALDRSIVIDSSTDMPINLIDDREHGGQTTSELERTRDALIMHCNISKAYNWPYCDMTIRLGYEPFGINLENFSSLELDIETTGPGDQKVRVYLRNYNSSYSTTKDATSLKVNEVQYIPASAESPVSIPLKNFQVSAWWLSGRNLSPEQASPEMNNVSIIEIATGDSYLAGQHSIRVKQIVFKGKWVSFENILLIIIIMWVGAALIYLISSNLNTKKQLRDLERRKQELQHINEALELQAQEHKESSAHDLLTGTFNRIGLRDHLVDCVTAVKQRNQRFSVIFIEIENYLDLYRNHDEEKADALISQVAKVLRNTLRPGDYLGRWSKSRFIILCPGTSLSLSEQLSEKIRLSLVATDWMDSSEVLYQLSCTEMESTEDISAFINRSKSELYKKLDN